MHTDRRTDMTKLIVAIRNFAKASKNMEQEEYRERIYMRR
jgi:hypothetical protein